MNTCPEGVIGQELLRIGWCVELKDQSLGGPGARDNKIAQEAQRCRTPAGGMDLGKEKCE